MNTWQTIERRIQSRKDRTGNMRYRVRICREIIPVDSLEGARTFLKLIRLPGHGHASKAMELLYQRLNQRLEERIRRERYLALTQ